MHLLLHFANSYPVTAMLALCTTTGILLLLGGLAPFRWSMYPALLLQALVTYHGTRMRDTLETL